jgi:hypothetical protein
MRRRRRNHQKQPTIDRLGAAPASRRMEALGASRVTVAPIPTSRLKAAPRSRRAALGVPGVTAALVSTSRLKATPGPACVPWASAPASRRKAAPGAPRVPAAPGRMKTVEPSSSENRAPETQGSSRGSTCPRGSGPNENHRADAEDLAELGRCKATPIQSKWNRAQGAAVDSYRIDPDSRW